MSIDLLAVLMVASGVPRPSVPSTVLEWAVPTATILSVKAAKEWVPYPNVVCFLCVNKKSSSLQKLLSLAVHIYIFLHFKERNSHTELSYSIMDLFLLSLLLAGWRVSSWKGKEREEENGKIGGIFFSKWKWHNSERENEQWLMVGTLWRNIIYY